MTATYKLPGSVRTVEAYKWPSGVDGFDESEVQRHTITQRFRPLGRAAVWHSLILAERCDSNHEWLKQLTVDPSGRRIVVNYQYVDLEDPSKTLFEASFKATREAGNRRLGEVTPAAADYGLLIEELKYGVAFRRIENAGGPSL
jgi:hypothetical protein